MSQAHGSASPRSALESIHSVRMAQAPYWMSLQQQGQCGLGWWVHLTLLCSGHDSEPLLDVASVLSPSTNSLEGKPVVLLPGGPTCEAAATTLSCFLDRQNLCPMPHVRTAVALTAPDTALPLPPDELCQEGSAPREETEAWARCAGWDQGGGCGHACAYD